MVLPYQNRTIQKLYLPGFNLENRKQRICFTDLGNTEKPTEERKVAQRLVTAGILYHAQAGGRRRGLSVTRSKKQSHSVAAGTTVGSTSGR